MQDKARWLVRLYLTDQAEVVNASIDVLLDGKSRESVVFHPGPFDTPDEVVRLAVELVEAGGREGKLPI